MKKFEILEHTADIGLVIYGKDLQELFTNAAEGLFSLITDIAKAKNARTIKVKLTEDNREELLISWLNELLFQFTARSFIPHEFAIDSITDKSITARLRGERLDCSRHKIKTEIKAATFHELEVKTTPGGLSARVIFDT